MYFSFVYEFSGWWIGVLNIATEKVVKWTRHPIDFSTLDARYIML